MPNSFDGLKAIKDKLNEIYFGKKVLKREGLFSVLNFIVLYLISYFLYGKQLRYENVRRCTKIAAR